MRRVHHQQLAAELGAAAVLVPGDQQVHAEREHEQPELPVADVDAMGAAHEVVDRLPHQLEAGDRQETHDGERAERLELAVAIGMVLIGLLGCHANHDQGDHVVERVHAGIHRAAQDGQRPGCESHPQLHPHDRQVGDQEADEHSADEGGRRHGQECKVVKDSGLVNGELVDRAQQHTLQVTRLRGVDELRVVAPRARDGEELEAGP